MDHTILPVLPQPAQISYPQQTKILNQLIAQAALTGNARARISQNATALIQRIRTEAKPSLIDSFLVEYGLSNAEGVALIRLAEALLRVPDAAQSTRLLHFVWSISLFPFLSLQNLGLGKAFAFP